MTDKTTLIDFPCHFPIKIIGTNSTQFIEEIKSITLKHFPDFNESNIVSKASKHTNYLSLSASVYALDQAMLDAYYKEVCAHPMVRMVL